MLWCAAGSVRVCVCVWVWVWVWVWVGACMGGWLVGYPCPQVTPLYSAISYNHPDITRYLVAEAKADPDIRMKQDGATALVRTPAPWRRSRPHAWRMRARLCLACVCA